MTRGRGHHRQAELTNAYLVGSGIAALAAAAHLIHDAHVPPTQIHIFESGKEGTQNTKTPKSGYFLWPEQMLNFSCVCLYDLLSIIPSLENPAKTVKQEIDEFNAGDETKTCAKSRLIARGEDGPLIVDASDLGLREKDRLDLVAVFMQSEKKLSGLKVTDCFEELFFKSNFWVMWATMFLFQPCHSAIEFRRYLRRFILGLPRINTLDRLDRTPYNHYDSIIRPIEVYLKSQGVNFRYDTGAVRLSFTSNSDFKVEEIQFCHYNKEELIPVKGSDIVFLTVGSTTACASVGANDSPSGPLPPSHNAIKTLDTGWSNWSSLFFTSLVNTSHISELGNPMNFYSNPVESSSLWFTTTLANHEFIRRFEELTTNNPGRGGLTTLKDSSWLVSIVVPQQPYFLNQPDDVHVFWGYALFPEKSGDFVRKPMFDCTGREIFTELLGHLNFPDGSCLSSSITVPCTIPYATSPLLVRAHGGRPHVIPKKSINMALLGEFVEIPEEGSFALEYGIRSAQSAVFEMMGMKKKPKDMYNGDRDIKSLAKALKTLVL